MEGNIIKAVFKSRMTAWAGCVGGHDYEERAVGDAVINGIDCGGDAWETHTKAGYTMGAGVKPLQWLIRLNPYLKYFKTLYCSDRCKYPASLLPLVPISKFWHTVIAIIVL